MQIGKCKISTLQKIKKRYEDTYRTFVTVERVGTSGIGWVIINGFDGYIEFISGG